MKKVLVATSYILHPVLIPVIGTLFYLLLDINAFNEQQKYLILTQIGIITFFIPISFLFLLRSLGKIDSVALSNLPQRKIPLFIQIVLFYILLSKSITIEVIPELFFFFSGAMCSVFIAFVFTFFGIKASLHMIGISALTVFVGGLSIHNEVNTVLILAMLVFMNGIVATSRLEMKAHTVTELSIGFFSGLVPQLVLWHAWL